ENPSYSDGTTATSASAYSSTTRSSLTPCTNWTTPSSPSRSMVAWTGLSSRSRPITTRWQGRSVRTLATASSRGTSPFMGTSAQGQLAADGGGVGQVEVAVDGDGVVEGGDERPAVLHQAQQAPAEALVVVDQVELATSAGQLPPHPPAVGERLGEAGGAHEPE